jgi:hypothetical protein
MANLMSLSFSFLQISKGLLIALEDIARGYLPLESVASISRRLHATPLLFLISLRELKIKSFQYQAFLIWRDSPFKTSFFCTGRCLLIKIIAALMKQYKCYK